ncbi:Trm112 family protein [uncultured Stenotrophomonas sp.]|uniref:Trm112 family protein n=1 Tax=uncultured Stenotrophomonas sp. TaxID=165438 RepID=UPI0028E8CA4D|nr:Trm112 family protein [uncultured Stenotrophomonas sp.]
MDRKVIDRLCSPTTRQPLSLLDATALKAVNQAIAANTVSKADGAPRTQPLGAALVTRDRKELFPVDDGIPVLLAEEAIDTAQIADFPEK